MHYFKNLRITTKFILSFLFIALIPFTIATYVSYRASQKAVQKEIANNLRTVTDNKANQIEAYLNEKEKNATTLSHMSDVIDAMEGFNVAWDKGGAGSPEYTTAEGEFRPFLSYSQKTYEYDDLLLVHTNGDIVFSAENKNRGISLYEKALYGNSELAKVFIKAKDSLKAEISDFEYDAETGKAALFIAAPLLKGADTVGFIAFQMSTQGVSGLVKDYTGLGKTGETAIAAKIKDKIVFITPLRFDSDAAFKRTIKIGSVEVLDIQKAIQGERGLGIMYDYRGKKVLSVWRYLPSFRWGLIVKMDIIESFASANQLRNLLATISLALIMFVVIAAVFISRSISNPIKRLTGVSALIAKGELWVRAAADTTDEIGELAYAFNQMTDKLIEAKANVEEKKAEVEEQKKLLEKANRELDSFVYTTSHDLQAPLRAISAFANFLDEDYKDKLDAQGKDYLKEIREGTARMSQLIADLLTLSRISRIKNPYEDVDINALIDSVVKRIQFDIEKHRVELKIQKGMPIIVCDRIKMGEVFLNLINNAIKFSSKNTKTPRVEAGYMDMDEFHKFYVKDNGIGIDRKHHQEVFEIFKRLHTASEYEGTGAGLSIVKRVIDDHGGKIWIESELGKGATFFFTIPKALKKQPKETSSGESTSSATHEQKESQENISDSAERV